MSKRYGAIDGLRAYAAIGIVMMHVLTNGKYHIPTFIGERLIPSLTNLVFLFMTISAFGLCCGYYERFVNGNVNLESFYKKRFFKVLPFFVLLSAIDVVLSPSKEAAIELFANATLMFGLLPNANITVIGVGWFLGVIFVFYLLFPFFTVLLKNKKRAWISLVIAILLNIVCSIYFFDGDHVLPGYSARTNILYCSMFFMAGGLIYLYRDKIETLNKWMVGTITVLCVAVYYLLQGSIFTCLFVTVVLLMLGITVSRDNSKNPRGGGVLENRFTAFLGSISLEIYLCHMVFFRAFEKLHLTRVVENDIVAYVITVVGVLVLASLFSIVVKILIDKAMNKMNSRKKVELNENPNCK